MALYGAKAEYYGSSSSMSNDVQSYTKIISDVISNQRPNTSLNDAPPSSLDACLIPSHYDTEASSCVSFDRYSAADCEDRSRLLVILRWCTTSLRDVSDAYLSSPMVLAIVPLVIGLSVGIVLGWWLFSSAEKGGEEGEGGCSSEDERRRRTGTGKSSIRFTRRRAGETSYDGILSGTAALRPVLFLWTTVSHLLQLTLLRGIPRTSSLPPVHTNDTNDTNINTDNDANDNDNDTRDSQTRQYLRTPLHTSPQSNVPPSSVPHHIAVIMDGNRRYGRAKYGSATRGHWDGSRTLVEFCRWCMAEGVKVLTVYAFSTENWERGEGEVTALMTIFLRYSQEVREEALERGIKVNVLSTEDDKFPDDVMAGLTRMSHDTQHCDKFTLNICLSYGSRGEIINACRSLASDAVQGKIALSDITEASLSTKMLTYPCPDPDVVIRTSGEFRLSNFLLWQLAYAEMFFVEKRWPELTKGDLIEVIRSFADQRERRFGK